GRPPLSPRAGAGAKPPPRRSRGRSAPSAGRGRARGRPRPATTRPRRPRPPPARPRAPTRRARVAASQTFATLSPAAPGSEGTMPRPGLSNADRLAGGLIEGAMAVHHPRRLRHIGHAARIDPPDDGLWAAGDPPPRAGNALEILVDGAQALPEIARAIRGARRHVHIARWSITPHFASPRAPRAAVRRRATPPSPAPSRRSS